MIDPEIFREYDIRGVVGEGLSDEVAYRLGRAFGAFLRKRNPQAQRISVGRDARVSSETLAHRVIEGVLSAGLDVLDLGLCPTPLQYFSLHHADLDGGIMVTGSHNPPEYNGFKVSIGKETIFGEDIQELRRIAELDPLFDCEEGNVKPWDVLSEYRDFMTRRFGYLGDARYRRPKVVVDAGNGTGGVVAVPLLESMGCNAIPLYCEPDGRFPNHHPDPTVVENMRDLIHAVAESGADIGVAYDGDADRIGVVDRAGSIIWGDQLMVILARDILKKRPGAVIIGDVKCSQRMFDDIERRGGRSIMWKTGHSLVKDKMKKEGAALAGEFSGHIFIADDYFGFDDALYASFRIVEVMKTSGLGIRELLSGVPQMHATPEIRIDCPDDKKRHVVERLVQRFKNSQALRNGPLPIRAISDIDGVRVVFERGWGLVRSSNTQPVVVMRFEAEDEESLRAYERIFRCEFELAVKAEG